MLLILEQISFIGDPFFSKLVKICKIKWRIQGSRLIVIHFSFTVELVIFPFSFISYPTIGIEKPSKTMHLIVDPLSIIDTSLLKYHHTMTPFFSIF